MLIKYSNDFIGAVNASILLFKILCHSIELWLT